MKRTEFFWHMQMNRAARSSRGMSQRKRALITIGFAVINSLGFMAFTISVSPSFIWPTLLIPVGAGIYLLSLRCPDCGSRIYKRKVKLFGEEFTYWGGFVPKKCSHCGKEL